MAKIKVQRPNREPDHYSKRDVPYWWAPEWVRGTAQDYRHITQDQINNGTFKQSDVIFYSPENIVSPCFTYGKIHAVKEKKTVNLHMKSKDGNLSYIQGSIQEEFKRWHQDRSIDYMLLGLDPDEIIAQED